MDIIDGVYLNAGDVNLFIKVLGEGAPPIVIEPGIGGLSVEWYYIQKELSKITTVVTYDRAGYGESPKSKSERTSFNIANQLFNLLFNSDVEHPYILVGHLEGGLYIQHFAKMFRYYVAGVVLVDSLFDGYFRLESEDYPHYNQIASYNVRANNLKNLIGISNEEFPKKILPILHKIYDGFPDEYKIPIITYQSDKKFYEVVVDEITQLRESFDELRDGFTFPKVPLAVVTHDPSIMQELSEQIGIPTSEARSIEEFWLESQKNLAQLSPRSNFYIAQGSDKNIHYSNPLFLIDVIKKMIEEVRNDLW